MEDEKLIAKMKCYTSVKIFTVQIKLRNAWCKIMKNAWYKTMKVSITNYKVIRNYELQSKMHGAKLCNYKLQLTK